MRNLQPISLGHKKMDLLLLGITIVFFGLSVGLIEFIDSLTRSDV